ncbi:MAG: N-acetyl-alpha-D-glucosaminyl L-malate synthase BshA [Candidatus Latescibacterota bacterium]
MNIGITCYPTYGGSGTVATELGKNLAQRGNKVHFITTSLPYRLSDFIENIYFHEVNVLHYPLFDYPPYTLALASKMAQVALREDLDLLHVHYAVPHATSAYLARNMLQKKRRLPFITTLHGTDITLVGTDPSYFEITKFAIEESDAVTAVSSYLKKQTIERFSMGKEIEVIPNFVDTDKFSPGTLIHRSHFADPDEKILMHISNFRPVKRVKDIVKVFEGVLKQVKARLIFVGSGPELETAIKMIEEMGLASKVHLLGRQVDVSCFIPLADIYLLLSEHESFGLTALEAMSCGVPVIGTSGSGMEEFLGDGKAGRLSPVGAIDEIVENCVRILKDPDLGREMGGAGRNRAKERYSQESITQQYIQLYERIAG